MSDPVSGVAHPRFFPAGRPTICDLTDLIRLRASEPITTLCYGVVVHPRVTGSLGLSPREPQEIVQCHVRM